MATGWYFDQITVNDICPVWFVTHRLSRIGSRGGDDALLHKKRFKLKKLSAHISYRSFEFTDCSIDYLCSSLRIVVVYRPPPSKKNRLNVSLFLDEFSSLLERLITSSSPLIIGCDFTFHLDDEFDRAAARFQDLLEVFNLVQNVQSSTHTSGHTLDLVICRQGEEPVKNVRVTDPVISDHSAVH